MTWLSVTDTARLVVNEHGSTDAVELSVLSLEDHTSACFALLHWTPCGVMMIVKNVSRNEGVVVEVRMETSLCIVSHATKKGVKVGQFTFMCAI